MGFLAIAGALGISAEMAFGWLADIFTGKENRRMTEEQQAKFDELDAKIEAEFGRLEDMSADELQPMIDRFSAEAREYSEEAGARFDTQMDPIRQGFSGSLGDFRSANPEIRQLASDTQAEGKERLQQIVNVAQVAGNVNTADRARIEGQAADTLGYAQTSGADMIAEARAREQAGLGTGQDIIQATRNRLTTGMGYLEGQGEQERLDLERDWGNQQSAAEAGLMASGLGGSSVMASMGAGYQEGLSADRRRLEEGLNREHLGYYTGLSGDVINAQSAQQGVAANLSGDVINTMGGQQGVEMGARGNLVNTLTEQQMIEQGLRGNFQGALQYQYAGENALNRDLLGTLERQQADDFAATTGTYGALGDISSADLGYRDQWFGNAFNNEWMMRLMGMDYQTDLGMARIENWSNPYFVPPQQWQG